jgi:hypothetical protein
MKGRVFTEEVYDQGFEWSIKRRKDIELPDEPSTRCYELMVTHPALPHWGFRDMLIHKRGEYINGHNSTTSSTQKGIATYMINGIASKSFLKCWEDRHGEKYNG